MQAVLGGRRQCAVRKPGPEGLRLFRVSRQAMSRRSVSLSLRALSTWTLHGSSRSMRINEPPRPRYLFTNTFYDALSDYVGLTSLSLCTPEPKFTCPRLSSLSFSNNLRRLDLRAIRRHDRIFWETVTIALPNLRELRLGATEYIRSERMASVFRIPDRDEDRGNVYTNLNEFAVCTS